MTITLHKSQAGLQCIFEAFYIYLTLLLVDTDVHLNPACVYAFPLWAILADCYKHDKHII
jgi:hypothetical protein